MVFATPKMAVTSVLGASVVLLSATFALGAGPVQFTETLLAEFNWTEVDVNFEAWAPNNWEHLRGVVIAFPGTGGDHRDLATDSDWQKQMAGLGFAILGVEYSDDGGVYSYIGEANWPGQVSGNIQILLDRMADELGHPELTNAPVFPFGFSHGASMANEVSLGFGERTLGFVADKLFSNEMPSAPDFTEVPGLFVGGRDDPIITAKIVSDNYNEWRAENAKVAQIVDNDDHNEVSEKLIFAYLNEVVRERYPENQLPSLTPGNPLHPVDIPTSAGWLGETIPLNASNRFTFIDWPAITLASDFTGDPLTRGWLPNETMAMVYRAENAQPVGITGNLLDLEVEPSLADPSQLQVTAGTTSGSYEGIDLYDESGLFAQIGSGSGMQLTTYTPSEQSNHTFIAVMRYTHNAETHYASTYITYGLEVGLTGDYNDDGVVDAADYTVWRDAQEDGDTTLLNRDPSKTGQTVDEDDYMFWRNNFGTTSGGGSGQGSAPVPEPASFTLLFLAGIMVAGIRVARGGRSPRGL